MSTYIKDPDARGDYAVNWSSWLVEGDTITASQWIISDAALVEVASSFTDVKATIRLSGGVDGEKYSVTNRITTLNGLIEDQTITIKMAEK